MSRSFACWMAAVLVVGGFTATASSAHHSFNAYDMSKTAKAAGTIKEFRWGAPHSSMVLIYKDAKGAAAQMSLASGSPLAFSKQGFTPRDFHKGQKVSVTYHPNVSGAPGGALASLATADGRKYSDAETAAAISGGPAPAPVQ